MACFNMIYGFMSSLLHLDGYSKEIYALLFGFWIRSQKPVTVPYSVIRNTTGATDPTISACVKNLKDRGLISPDQKPGRRTKYDIILTEEIWEAYLRDSGRDKTTKVPEELSSVKASPKVLQKTTKFPEGYMKRKDNNGKGSTPSNLSVSSASSVSSRVTTIKITHSS